MESTILGSTSVGVPRADWRAHGDGWATACFRCRSLFSYRTPSGPYLHIIHVPNHTYCTYARCLSFVWVYMLPPCVRRAPAESPWLLRSRSRSHTHTHARPTHERAAAHSFNCVLYYCPAA